MSNSISEIIDHSQLAFLKGNQEKAENILEKAKINGLEVAPISNSHAWLLARTGRIKEGLMELETAELEAKRSLANNAHYKGHIARLKGNDELAEHLYKEAITLAKEIDDWELIGEVNGELGNIFRRKGEDHFATANTFLKESLSIFERFGNKKGIALANSWLGTLRWNEKEYPKAKDHFQIALKLNTELKRTDGVVINYNDLGNLAQAQEQFEEALEYYLKGMELEEKISRSSTLGSLYGNIASCHYALGRPEIALAFLEKAEKLFLEIGNIQRVKAIRAAIDKVREK